MPAVEPLFKTAVDEIERMLNSKTVVGETLTVGDNIIIPLVSVGFGFAAGGGEGREGNKTEGNGAGTGGGGGVRPVAVLIVNSEGVHLEPVKSGAASAMEKIAESIAKGVKSEH